MKGENSVMKIKSIIQMVCVITIIMIFTQDTSTVLNKINPNYVLIYHCIIISILIGFLIRETYSICRGMKLLKKTVIEKREKSTQQLFYKIKSSISTLNDEEILKIIKQATK
ncbi:hypothetical protein CF088_19160 [Clostridium botulinum]|nr:hypothetical protein CLK_A0080 [Clostridium botulinum A3 str. Loch Maree]MBN3380742.1 hypothetical protein [Clostridium botulinum]MBN3407343.1 hypothetical protein [Clostridium botulinum]QDY17217.1 hypothetical protein CGQ27_08965 [Clostridium botulinum]